MEGYYIIYINDILIILSFKGRYFLLSYNGKFEKYPPYPPLRVSEGEFGILLGRLFAGGIRLFRFSRQQVLYLLGSALHHHPIVCVGGLYLPEAQLAHGTAHLLETQPQRGVAETTDDLAAGGIDSPFQPHGLAVVGQDQFVLRTGHLKLLHMAAQLLDLFIGKPVTEIYILVECVRLAVDALVGDVRLPRAVYVLHLEGQPSPVPRVIGEELEVVPGGYERGYMGQVHLVASVGSALVHVALRHHRLQLVQLRGGHGIDLLQIDHQVLGHGEQVVLGHAARVALCGVIFGQYGRQDMLHERGLVTALPPYQGEDHLVHHGLVQGGGNHGHHPPFQDVGKADGSFGEVVPFPAFVLLQRTVRTFLDMHHGGQPVDVVGLSVPGRQTVQILFQRMIFLDEITAEQRMQLVQVDRHAMVLHGAPQGVLDVVGEPLPVAGGSFGTVGVRISNQLCLNLVGKRVHPELHIAVDKLLHLLHGGLLMRGIILFLLFSDGTGQGNGVELHRERVTTFYDGQQLLARIIGKSPEGPCLGVRLRNTVAVGMIETTAYVVVVAARCVCYSFLFQLCTDNLVGTFRRHGHGSAALRLLAGLHSAGVEGGGFGAEQGFGVVAEDRHARGVLALSVNLHSAQASVMVVHPLPYHAVVGLGHSALHVADDPDAASRDGDVHQKGMNILLYQSQDGGESLGGDAVYVHHDKSRESLDMGVGSPSLQQDGGDECRLCVLQVAFGELPLLQLLRVACRLDVGQRGQMGAVMTGGGGVGAVGYLLEKNLPGGGVRPGVAQGVEARWVA